MAKLDTLLSLLVHEIKDLYSAETQLVQALPKLAAASASRELAEAFNMHLDETLVHVERLEKVAELLGESPGGKTCQAMKGLVKEGEETIAEEGEATIRDLALIGAAQKVEHYEISGYGTARALAVLLGLGEVVDYLQVTLEEEGEADKKLTALAEMLAPSVGSTAIR